MVLRMIGWRQCLLTGIGNRKPQLVTTDFDVLEDMLVKDWDVAYSFGIRYKHLMTNPQGQQETDEDIDHILGVQSGEEDGGGEDDDVKCGSNNDRDSEDIDEDDSEDDVGQGGLTGQYLQASGYTNAPQYPHPHHTPGPPPKQQQTKLHKSNERGFELPTRPQPPSRLDKSQPGYGHLYPYSPLLDSWGRPIPYGGPDGYGHGGYSMHSGYAGYGPPFDSDGRYPSQPPPGYSNMGHPFRHSMTPAPGQPDADRKRIQGSPFGSNKHMRGGYEQSPFPMGRHPQGHGYPPTFHAPRAFKQESPEFSIRGDARSMSVSESAAPTPTTEPGEDRLGEDRCVEDRLVEDRLVEDSSAAALEAELRATELELKVARLQAKRAALAKTK
jgi:hypothetical protein